MRATVFYSGGFVLPLPAGHRFPMRKYRLLYDAVVAEGLGDRVGIPPAVTDQQLCLAHTPAWVRAVATGGLTRGALRRIGFPWSPAMVERARRSAGATVAAARAALRTGLGINLAGGTHHALADRAEGYCVFNDVAVAIRVLQREGRIRRALVVDGDVHQGNGTAAIFAGDPSVVTVDLYAARNFPFVKVPAVVDVPLADGTADADYLAALEGALAEAMARGPFDLGLYVAGADAWVGDALGRLALSREGLAARDRAVRDAFRAAGLPAVLVMGGGYAPDIADTVAIHGATIRLLAAQGGGAGATKIARAAAMAASSPTSTTVSPGANRKPGSGV